jgi:hypothetical protein
MYGISYMFRHYIANWASIEHLWEGTRNAPWGWQCNAETCRSYHTYLLNRMNNWCICWFFTHIFTGVLIFKALTPRRLYKSFGVKRLNWRSYIVFCVSLEELWEYIKYKVRITNRSTEDCHIFMSYDVHHVLSYTILLTNSVHFTVYNKSQSNSTPTPFGIYWCHI